MGTETNKMKKVISTHNAPAAIGPYSQAILSGNTLYCSGQIAINPATGDLVIDNITAETTQVMQNIEAVLNGDIGIFCKEYLKWRRQGSND